LSQIKLRPTVFVHDSNMPYRSNEELPPAVRKHLPAAAQSIYREVFNHAWQTYGREPRHEEIAHRTAWAAVKRRYEKGLDGMWHPKAPAS
jgi:cation transport regulator